MGLILSVLQARSLALFLLDLSHKPLTWFHCCLYSSASLELLLSGMPFLLLFVQVLMKATAPPAQFLGSTWPVPLGVCSQSPCPTGSGMDLHLSFFRAEDTRFVFLAGPRHLRKPIKKYLSFKDKSISIGLELFSPRLSQACAGCWHDEPT